MLRKFVDNAPWLCYCLLFEYLGSKAECTSQSAKIQLNQTLDSPSYIKVQLEFIAEGVGGQH